MFKWLYNKAKKAIKGEERLWKVFWLWGVLLYVVSNLIGFYSMLLPSVVSVKIATCMLAIVGVCGVILVFVYPIVWMISMWKCRNNIKSTFLLVLTFFSSLFFLYVQALWCFWVLFLSLGYIENLLNVF